MKRLLTTIMVIVAGLSVIAPDISAQNSNSAQVSKRQQNMESWKQDMQKFSAKIKQEHKLNELADSLASIQAIAAMRNQDFVLQIDNVTFSNGNTVYVNSNINFLSVKGDRAVVQISPSNFAPGPNGLGGVTVDGIISGYQIMTDKKGRVNLTYNVSGIGLNAQIEVYIMPGSSSAQATVYPNFNSNTLWISGTVVPYENADVMEGSSL
jgi:ATPase subunit of ABC transporter with duplicated ATPase domains